MAEMVLLGGMELEPLAILSLQVGSLPTEVLPSQIGTLEIVQTQAKWPNWRHFLHWLGILEYMISRKIVSFGIALFAIEGMQMWPTSLLMSWISTIIIGPACLFTYDSTSSISRTSPILLAIIVRALSFLNCSWRSGNWTFIVCMSITSAPWALELKFETYLKKKKFMPLHSTKVIFQVVLAPSSSKNKTSKKLHVNKVAETKKVDKWNFK